ncbi:uncharacterized protein MELLADRAFT_96415 [Melampsora larici-populina 98AG31]|uniref:Uncharacterized protein n=1 Tax=Melampsora larici-populina (strain 98AG31 / pathotype 3-4-7) TaxID=747676 RepID=F4RER3_MELLP|nr:uncharacterized protein MELLADRAFT_96415 [Melampsora larici-populina 98AG31]EGG09145.1 hypothetical protein MELLADRAFT_96415 [Melampsora larici-populina 98AG31]
MREENQLLSQKHVSGRSIPTVCSSSRKSKYTGQPRRSSTGVSSDNGSTSAESSRSRSSSSPAFSCYPSIFSKTSFFHALTAAILTVRQDMMSNHEKIFSKIEEINERISTALSSSGGGWDESSELKASFSVDQCVKSLSVQCIMDGDVQAYTATSNREGDEDNLPLCLHAKVMHSAILSNPTEWKKRLLPAGYGKNPNPKATKAMQKLLSNILKQTRKEFETILLSEIHLPQRVKSSDCSGNVPNINTIIVKLHEKEKSQIGGRVQVREEILRNVQHLCKTRYAYLRMQAVHWGVKSSEYGSQSYWSVVDQKLESLRGQSTRYRYVFFVLVMYDDYDRFNGKHNFDYLTKKKIDFSLPSEERIQEEINTMELKFGDDMGEDEVLHKN